MSQLGRTLISVVLAAALWATFGSASSDVDSSDADWKVYRNDGAGIEVSYPVDWSAVVAVEPKEGDVARSPAVLEEGELHRVAFIEGAEAFWPGRYEVRILANPDTLDLDAYYSQFDLSDLWNGTASDSILAGQEAKTWVRWTHESLVREYLLVTPQRVVHLLHDEHNSNDPAFRDHEDIYHRITSTVRILPTVNTGRDTTAVPHN